MPGGVVFRYAETTRFTGSEVSKSFPAIYYHERRTHPSAAWTLLEKLPAFLQFGIKIPRSTCLGAFSECVSDQALWFSIEGQPKDRNWKVSLADENGYETEVEWTDYHNGHLIVPGVGPRRSKRLTAYFVEDHLESPAGKITFENPLRPTGSPLVETDHLPVSRNIGGYTVTLKSIVREKFVRPHHTAGGERPGLRISWEIARNGVARPEWQLVGGSLADGGGNFCLLRVSDSKQLSLCYSALFSDDPVWKIKLLFRRTEDNEEDYHPLMHIADLPLPERESSINVDKTFLFPPWTVTIGKISRFYSAAWHMSQTCVEVRVPNFAQNDFLQVVRSDLRYCTNAGMSGGPVNGELIFYDPENTKPWSMDLGADTALETEFQCRVQFVP